MQTGCKAGMPEGMSASFPYSLAIRSYGSQSNIDRHDFAQLVLPLVGSLEMDIAGRGGLVGRGQAAFVEARTRHDQISDRENRSFILDFDPANVTPSLQDRLVRRPYLPLSPAATKLVDYMALMAADAAVPAETVERWAPLLLDALDGAPPRPHSRLSALLSMIEAAPGAPWTATGMAERAGLSVSRLHALFREELNTTPRAWLAQLRLNRVREWLGTTDLSIAELAYRSGYADQSALTRAMRKATGLTPAAYRRQVQDSGSKKREP